MSSIFVFTFAISKHAQKIIVALLLSLLNVCFALKKLQSLQGVAESYDDFGKLSSSPSH